MDIYELKSRTTSTPAAVQIAPWALIAGWVILSIYWLRAFPLASTIREYFVVSKTERDAAQASSALANTLDTIQTTSAILEPLKFVGLTLIIVGISLFLIAILQTLKLRGEATKLAMTARKSR